MENNPESDLSDCQYGFRRHRSTVDALFKMRSFIRASISRGGVAIAVDLDISNAFNSIPWSGIKDVLKRKGFPDYLRSIIHDYLSNRSILYKVRDGHVVQKKVQAGVPQGSVLGPLLWNIAFDSILRLEQKDGCCTICYADDTLIVATVAGAFDAALRANIMVARIVRRIKELGLTIAANKTEAVFFYGKNKPHTMPIVFVDVKTTTSMKYLGVIIDSKWSFADHFAYVESKAAKVSR